MDLINKTYHYSFLHTEISFLTTRLISFNDFDSSYFDSLVLDFRKASWITPFGILFIYSLAYQLSNEFPEHKIQFIFSKVNFTYLCRMHLTQKLIAFNNVSINPEPTHVIEHDRTDSLYEIKIIEFENQYDTDNKADELFELISINTKPCDYNSIIINTALSELFDNIYSHSGQPKAIIVAQAYPDYIRIAIGDTGIGIPNKLRSLEEYKQLDDTALINEAIKPNVTTRHGGGGTGLTDLCDTITDSQIPGVLMIRSNLGSLWLRSGFAQAGRINFNIEGTYMGLLLNREN